MKQCIAFFILLAFINYLKAQNASLDIGVKTGAGISAMFVESAAQDIFEPKLSYALVNGLSVNYNTKSIFQVQADLLFTRKGYLRSGIATFEDSTALSFNITRSFDYFNISILPGIQTKGNTNFRINVGPYVGLLYNEGFTSKLEGYKQTTSNRSSKTLKTNQKIDLGAVVEIAINQRINDKLNLEIGVRNEMSLFRETPFFIYKPAKFFTSSVFVGLNYRFGL